MLRTHHRTAAAAVVAFACLTSANADTLIQSGSDNGFFTPFNSGNAATTTYGDSWWIGSTGTAYSLTRVTIGLASFNGAAAGTTDITVGIHDGDPSGAVFGTGSLLYSTTVSAMVIPSSAAGPAYFDLVLDLPSVLTTGGFNNVGLSISLGNFSYAGQFGFQVSTANGQTAGFYTNSASYNTGDGWDLFSFGPDLNTGIANYTVNFQGSPVPTPAAGSLLALGLTAAMRRRPR